MAEQTLSDLMSSVAPAPLMTGLDGAVDGSPVLEQPPAQPYHTTSEASEVVKIITSYVEATQTARKDRIYTNRANMEAYMGVQDYSEKIEGQSREFLPKTSVAAEQMAAFIKKSLIQFDDWFTVDISSRQLKQLGLDGSSIRNFLAEMLNRLQLTENSTTTFTTIISDAVKDALLNSLIILKTHGCSVEQRGMVFESGTPITDPMTGGQSFSPDSLRPETRTFWRPKIDLVRFEDYFPDATGRGLYEIHRSERDYHDVLAYAEAGVYDIDAVKSLLGTASPTPAEDSRPSRAIGQSTDTPQSTRKPLIIDEFWGTMLSSDGTVLHKNVVATVANYSTVIRKPTPNPFWHQESPFTVAPLIRVPHSVWHKAVYDEASRLNIALNEVFNLMLDGGLSSVWGVRQIRMDALEDPSQVEGGVPQGATLAVNSTLPPNAKVMETVTTGQIPKDAGAMFEALVREFGSAALTNDLKLGQLPGRQVLATEIIEQQQSQSVTMDGIVVDLEDAVMEPVLRKTFINILQYIDEMDPQEVINACPDLKTAMLLLKLKPPARYELFAKSCSFSVTGLSGTLNRVREFQRIMAFFQVIGQNPILAAAFQQRFDPVKTLRTIMKFLNVDPFDLERDEEGMARAPEDMQMLQQYMMAVGGAKGGTNAEGSPMGAPTDTASSSSMPAEISAMGNPLSGMPANG